MLVGRKSSRACRRFPSGRSGFLANLQLPTQENHLSLRHSIIWAERMARNEFDLIAVGRALLQDPDWVKKIRDGRQGELMTFTKEALATLY